MSLNEEIRKRRAEIFSDGYSMSVGELISMYEDKELDIHPQFQRFFRWSDSQKSRLIESLLLGIPIPSIFVSQRTDGVWDVVDGLQRLSTIFQLVGVLRDDADELIPPLQMTETKYLPSLSGKQWELNVPQTIGRDNQLIIKRSKIDVKIILRESSEASKYELFQRLNTGGSQLSDQELRNAIAIMIDPSFFEWVDQLSKDEHFQACVELSDRLMSERYDHELILRFLALRRREGDELRLGDVGDFLTDEITRFAEDGNLDRKAESVVFSLTFRALSDALGGRAFRRYDRKRDLHLGGFLLSAYEAFAIGLGWHIKSRGGANVDPESVTRTIKEIWGHPDFSKYTGSGVRASSRIPVIIPMAREKFGACLLEPKRS